MSPLDGGTWGVDPAVGGEEGGPGGAGDEAPAQVGRGALRLPLHRLLGQGGQGGQGGVPGTGGRVKEEKEKSAFQNNTCV